MKFLVANLNSVLNVYFVFCLHLGFVTPASFFSNYGINNTIGPGGGTIAKPIPRPAVSSAGPSSLFDPHLHALLSCRHPAFLNGKIRIPLYT